MFKTILISTILIIFVSILVLPKFKILYVKSESMKPTIEKGSLILIMKTGSYKEEDIISFRYNNSRILTHRVIGISKFKKYNLYVTKGDNNKYEDTNKVLDKEILGKTIFILNNPKRKFLEYFNYDEKIISCLLFTPLGFYFGKLIKQGIILIENI